MKALKKWVSDKNVTTLYCSAEIHTYSCSVTVSLQSMKGTEGRFHFMRKKAGEPWHEPQMCPLVLDIICLGCPTWGRSPRSPQRECLGRDWQTLQILHCPPGGYSQNHSPTPVRWSPRRPRSARCSFACCQASGLRARCLPLFETSPTLEVHDWFLQWRNMKFYSNRRAVTKSLKSWNSCRRWPKRLLVFFASHKTYTQKCVLSQNIYSVYRQRLYIKCA